MGAPKKLHAGDSYEATLTVDSDTESAVLYLLGPTAISITGSVSGTTATFERTSPGLLEGWYQASIRTTDTSGFFRTIELGFPLQVLPSVVGATGAAISEVKSHARRTLEAIEATIEGRATTDQQSVSINGRSISRYGLEELLRLRAIYRREVNAEEGTPEAHSYVLTLGGL